MLKINNMYNEYINNGIYKSYYMNNRSEEDIDGCIAVFGEKYTDWTINKKYPIGTTVFSNYKILDLNISKYKINLI